MGASQAGPHTGTEGRSSCSRSSASSPCRGASILAEPPTAGTCAPDDNASYSQHAKHTSFSTAPGGSRQPRTDQVDTCIRSQRAQHNDECYCCRGQPGSCGYTDTFEPADWSRIIKFCVPQSADDVPTGHEYAIRSAGPQLFSTSRLWDTSGPGCSFFALAWPSAVCWPNIIRISSRRSSLVREHGTSWCTISARYVVLKHETYADLIMVSE